MRKLLLSNIAINIAQNFIDYHAATEELYYYMRKRDPDIHGELMQVMIPFDKGWHLKAATENYVRNEGNNHTYALMEQHKYIRETPAQSREHIVLYQEPTIVKQED